MAEELLAAIATYKKATHGWAHQHSIIGREEVHEAACLPNEL